MCQVKRYNTTSHVYKATFLIGRSRSWGHVHIIRLCAGVA